MFQFPSRKTSYQNYNSFTVNTLFPIFHFTTYCTGSLVWGFLRPDFECIGSNSECSQTLLTPLLLRVCTIWSNVGLHVPFFKDFTCETWRPKLLWMLQHSLHNRIPLLTDAHEGSVRKVMLHRFTELYYMASSHTIQFCYKKCIKKG